MARQKYKSRPATMEDAFLWDIIEHPADDAPRLVYADWLDDTGTTEADRDRAEFIRLQVENARLRRVFSQDPRLEEMGVREEALLGRHRAEWLPGACERQGEVGWVFRRGFPDFAEVDNPAEFRKVVKQYAAVQPVPVRGIYLSRPDDVETAAWTRLLAGLSELEVYDDDPDSGPRALNALSRSPNARGITRLRLRGHTIPDGFLASGLVAGLSELQLEYTWSDECDALADLASSGEPGPLTCLNLYLSRFLHIARLADCPRFANLTELRIGWNDIDDSGIKEIRIRPEDVAKLAASRYLTKLTSLRVSDCAVRADGAAALASSPNLAGLEGLELQESEIDSQGVAALAASPLMGKLRYLSLQGNPDVRVAGVRSLLESALPDRLEILDLQGCRLPSPRKNPAVRELKARMGGRLFLDDR